MTDFKLIHGIYESVITHALEERLSRISDSFDVEKNQLDSEESSFALALHLTKLIANSLASIKGDDKKQRQAQSTTSVESPTGQRYIKGTGTILLFVRENKNGDGVSSSYCFLGPADYVSHNGSRPINVTWRLRYKMPARLCRMTGRMA